MPDDTKNGCEGDYLGGFFAKIQDGVPWLGRNTSLDEHFTVCLLHGKARLACSPRLRFTELLQNFVMFLIFYRPNAKMADILMLFCLHSN